MFNIKIKIIILPVTVEQAPKEGALGDAHGGESAEKKGLQGSKAFKKKRTQSSYVNMKNEGIPELTQGSKLLCLKSEQIHSSSNWKIQRRKRLRSTMPYFFL